MSKQLVGRLVLVKVSPMTHLKPNFKQTLVGSKTSSALKVKLVSTIHY